MFQRQELFSLDRHNPNITINYCQMKIPSTVASEVFETWHVTEILVGIPQTYLNMFLQRRLYGITAGVVGRRGEKNSRRFDDAEVFGIALAWLLFKSGLRTRPIIQILCDITGTKDANAREAAQVLLEARLRYLVVIRELMNPVNEAEGELRVQVTDWVEDVTEILANNTTASALVLPVGDIFDGIEHRMNVIQGA